MDSGALVRSIGGRWSSPSRRGFALEQELEQLIHEYPEILPGVGASALAVDQFSVPSGGSVDLIVLEPDATVTVVECKLAKNAEVRRSVVGQILSYAASLTQLDVDEFLERFAARLGGDAVAAIAPQAGSGETEGWDADSFRTALADTLSQGAFRLVIAVDRITDELRGIVEYLNRRTDDLVEVLALEIDLIAHDGVEVLVPRVHGLESARLKTQRGDGVRRGLRDVDPVLTAFDAALEPAARERIERFLEDLRTAGGYLQRGTGAYPSLSGYLRTPRGVRSLWSLTLDQGPLGGPQFFMNVNTWVDAFGLERVEVMLEELAHDALLAPVVMSVRERGIEKLHRVRIADVFGDEAAVVRLRRVLSDAMSKGEG